jgi:hypothetical protein
MPTDCQAGLDCVPCASAGAKCLGNMCWTTGVSSSSGCTAQGNPCTMSNGSKGQCTSWGNGIFGCSSLTSSPDQGAGTANSDYSVPSSDYNPGTGTKCGAGFTESAGVCFPTGTNLPDPSGGITTIITNILYWILSIFGVLAIIAFVISGIQYILSTGDEKMIDKAKSSMKWSIVGVVVALSGLIIIYAIDRMLRGSGNF